MSPASRFHMFCAALALASVKYTMNGWVSVHLTVSAKLRELNKGVRTLPTYNRVPSYSEHFMIKKKRIKLTYRLPR